MKKRIIGVTLLGAFCLAMFCGCGDGSREFGKGGGKVLTYLASSTTDLQAEKLQEIIDGFNEQIKDEGYKIEMESPGGEYYTSLGNMFNTSDAPDIFLMDGGNFASYARLGYLLDLGEYLENSELISEQDLWDINSYYRYDRTAGVGEGTLYGLIKDWSPDFMLLYNKTQLEEYNQRNPQDTITIDSQTPMTWQEFYMAASKIQKGLGIQYGTSIGFESYKHLMEWVQMTGSELFTDDYTKLNVQDSGVRSAFEFFCALQKDNAVEFPDYPSQNGGKAPATYTVGASVAEQESFKQGRMFSIFSGLWAFYTYGFYDVNFEIGIAPPPVYDKSDGVYAGSSGMLAHCISSTCQNPDIAFRFLEYYMTTGQEIMAGIGFNIPGNKTVAASDAFLNPSDAKVKELNNYFYNLALSGKVHPIEYNPKIGFDKMSTHMQNQFSKYFSGDQSFDEMLSELKRQLEQELII